ncbi:MAG: hypothetical protein JST85_29930 [Acidobacteria bacterium]|nr:hypothetical protein [Acidobacteriota bacterium]
MTDILVGLLFVLGIITVIGHAIWWMLAKILRAVFGLSPQPETQQISLTKDCVVCGASLKLKDEFCHFCGRPQTAQAKPDPLADLAMMTRQMDNFFSLGKLDLATYQTVMNAIEEERKRLTTPMRPLQVASSEPESQPHSSVPEINIEPTVTSQPLAAEPIPSIPLPPKPEKIVEPVFTASPTTGESIIEETVQEPSMVPAEPRRSLAEMLGTFMEESSIRWGELIGGLLIIGCSLALVISLWSQITAVPLLKFSVFVGVTAGLFGMGFYSAHRWKLPTTSRGALTISTLLVPLNFLAMTAFSQSADPNAALIIGGELAALALFSFLVYQAAKVITPGSSWLMAGATLLPSFSMLMAKHWQSSRAAIVWLAIAPLVSYWLATGMMLRGTKEEDRERTANRNFLMLGVASFAALLPFGLLLVKSGIFSITIRNFAALITLFGVPAIACGLTLRAENDVSGKTKTVATSVALLGALLSLGGLALAWPRLMPLIVVALINCAVCAVIAWRLDLKLAHAGAIVLFALAYLLAANVVLGGYPQWVEDSPGLIASFGTHTTGLALMSLFVLFGIAAELWRRANRREETHFYEIAAVVSGAISLLILTWHGFGRAGDPQQLTLVYSFYAAAAFVIAWHRDQFISSWVGLSLSLLTILQTFAFKFAYQLAPYHPVRLTMLTFASLTTAVVVWGLGKRSEKLQRVFVQPSTSAALIASIAAAPFVLFGGWMTMEQMTIRIFWLAAIWLALAVANWWRELFTAFQALLAVGIVCGVAAIFDAHALPSHLSWSDPHRLQAQGIALILLSLVWIAARLTVRDQEQNLAANKFERLLSPPWPKVDQIIVGLVWLLLIALSFGAFGEMTMLQLFSGEPRLVTDSFAERAGGIGSWVLLLALALAFAVSLWERFRKRFPLAMMTLLACGCLLLARHWSDSTVTALRWLAAISFGLAALPILFRSPLHRVCSRFNWPQMNETSAGLAGLARAESLLLFAAPVLAMTAVLFLTRPSDSVSVAAKLVFLLPLLIVSATLAAHAIREQSAIYAFTAGLILNFSATIGCLFDDNLGPITCFQVNVVTAAMVGLAWLSVRHWLAKRDEVERPVGWLLRFQIHATVLVGLLLLLFADGRILFEPTVQSASVAAMGNWLGWLAIALIAVAWLRLRKEQVGGWFENLSVDQVGVAMLAAVSLIVCSLSRAVDGWASYHALMSGVALTPFLIFAARSVRFVRLKIEDTRRAIGWVIGLSVAQFAMTLRGVEAPGSIWWTIASFSALSLLFGWMAIGLRHRGYVYLSALLLNLVASLLFANYVDVMAGLPEFLAVNVIVMSFASLVWLRLDLKLMRPAVGGLPFHRQSIFLSLPAVLLLSLFHWLLRLTGETAFLTPWLQWAAILSVAILLFAYCWEENVLTSLRGLYVLGWVVTLELCCLLPFRGQGILTASIAGWALYASAGSMLWRRRDVLARFAERLDIPSGDSIAGSARSWLLICNVVMTIFILLFGVGAVFSFPSLTQRLLVATSAFGLPAAFALLVRGRQDQRLITESIRLCLLNLVLWSWAWLSPVGLAGRQSINRLVIVMLIAAVVLTGYRLVVMRKVAGESVWRNALRADLPMLAFVGLASLAILLVVEFAQFSSQGFVFIGWPAIVAILLTLIGAAMTGIAFAVLPGEDPFNLDERGRMRYVYASEAFLVLTFAQMRMTMPWLFGGAFLAYWPILVMGLAFAGVGLAEFFRRQGRLALAQPLAKTGVMLPLLPVIGFWSVNSDVPYSGLLLLVGLFYGVVSIMRRSFAFGILAALAGNAGLWHFLNGVGGMAFYEHPQLWLIPAALSVLLAARINRESLSADQMNSIRYAALVTIYVSSTADIFLNGVVDSPWLPIILAVLAVGGVVAGLMLRIRAFLFLGTAFLLLSMLTMVWSASVNLRWTWLWYVTGIAFGVLIIYTVAMFERKREQMLGFLDRLKQWQ